MLRRPQVLLLTVRDIATGGQRHGTMSRFGRTLVKTLRPYAAHERAFHKTLELTKEGDYDLASPRTDDVGQRRAAGTGRERAVVRAGRRRQL